MKKLFLLIIVAYFIALFESGFMAHFFFPNLLFVYFLAVNVLESPERKEGLFLAGACGLLFDLFSSFPIGFYLVLFVFGAFLIKLILKRYVHFPSFIRS